MLLLAKHCDFTVWGSTTIYQITTSIHIVLFFKKPHITNVSITEIWPIAFWWKSIETPFESRICCNCITSTTYLSPEIWKSWNCFLLCSSIFSQQFTQWCRCKVGGEGVCCDLAPWPLPKKQSTLNSFVRLFSHLATHSNSETYETLFKDLANVVPKLWSGLY